MITRQQFIEQFGEDPIDVLGQDWQNEIYGYEDWSREQELDDIEQAGNPVAWV